MWRNDRFGNSQKMRKNKWKSDYGLKMIFRLYFRKKLPQIN